MKKQILQRYRDYIIETVRYLKVYGRLNEKHSRIKEFRKVWKEYRYLQINLK